MEGSSQKGITALAALIVSFFASRRLKPRVEKRRLGRRRRDCVDPMLRGQQNMVAILAMSTKSMAMLIDIFRQPSDGCRRDRTVSFIFASYRTGDMAKMRAAYCLRYDVQPRGFVAEAYIALMWCQSEPLADRMLPPITGPEPFVTLPCGELCNSER